MPVHTIGSFVRVKAGVAPNDSFKWADNPKPSSCGVKLTVTKYGAARDGVWVENCLLYTSHQEVSHISSANAATRLSIVNVPNLPASPTSNSRPRGWRICRGCQRGGVGRGLAALMVTYGVIEQGGCVISLLTAVSITHSFLLLSSTPAIRQHRGSRLLRY